MKAEPQVYYSGLLPAEDPDTSVLPVVDMNYADNCFVYFYILVFQEIPGLRYYFYIPDKLL